LKGLIFDNPTRALLSSAGEIGRDIMKAIILILALMLNTAMAQVDFGDFESLSEEDTITVLWSQYLDGELDPSVFYMATENIHLQGLSFPAQLRLQRMLEELEGLKGSAKIEVPKTLTEKVALKIAAELIHYEHLLGETSKENLDMIKSAKVYLEKIKNAPAKTKEQISDLFNNTPDYAYYNNGAYKNTLKLFLFCRKDRRYPCLFVMKDIFDLAVRNDDQTLWSLPALAKSRRNLPYNITNGYTPQGVHTLDSVMPQANRQQAFGKWRRVILNWIPSTQGDANTLEFLPTSSHNSLWWKEASVARDVGRKWLRIHGTGNRNSNRKTTYYPHVPSAGCITTREMKYDGVDYRDQRIILDQMMSAMQLGPVYANETLIKGVIYVVELDDKKKKVTVEDLKQYDIN
jgi:hypothetical protein